MAKIISHIYEDGGSPRLVVTHVFHGKNIQEARHIEQSHMKSDAFLRAAMTTKNYLGIKLQFDRMEEP